MKQKTYITSDNVKTFSKLQGAVGFADRGDIILVWDELDRQEKKLAKNIEIDELKVRTSEPKKVPDKWTDNIIEDGSEIDTVDIVKQIIANPSRNDVFDLLQTHEPPEPLVLWWLDKCFTDADYFRVLGEACRYGLFRGDNRYLWAAIAFGVEAGEGRFRWVKNDDKSEMEKSVKKRYLEEYDVREKELEEVWDDVKGLMGEWVEVDSEEASELGTDPGAGGDEDADEAEPTEKAGSLLDF